MFATHKLVSFVKFNCGANFQAKLTWEFLAHNRISTGFFFQTPPPLTPDPIKMFSALQSVQSSTTSIIWLVMLKHRRSSNV